MAANIQFGGLTTSAVTADQDILTYTPANTLALKTMLFSGYLTTYSATEANMGTVTWKQGGTLKMEWRVQNTDLDSVAGMIIVPLGDGLTFNGSDALLTEVTPASATSMRWTATYFFN